MTDETNNDNVSSDNKIARLQRINNQLQERLSDTLIPLPENTIMFFDGAKFMLNEQIIDKSLYLKEHKGKIIVEDSALFKKYVISLLKSEPISSIDCDEMHEIETIFSLCRKYGIEIDNKQLINISDSIGLNTVINEIKHIYNDCNKFWHINKNERYLNFRSYWDNHITLLSQINDNEKIKTLDNDYIVNAIHKYSYLEISKMNYLYDNIIFKYNDYMTKAIKNKSYDDISTANLKLTDIINGIVDSTDIIGLVNKAVGMIPDSVKNAGVQMLVGQITKLVKTSNILN